MRHFLLFCLLVCASAAFGQSSYWEKLNAPDGGTPTKITQTANGWVYAEFYDSTVFCSQDNGVHWQQIFWPSDDPDTGFAKITVGRAGTLFAERRVGDLNTSSPYFFDVFRSLDNGLTWQIFLDSSGVHGVGETSTGLLFALNDVANDSDEIIRSENGGANWEVVKELQFGDYFWAVEVDEYDRLIVAQDFSGPLLFSIDTGQTWYARYHLFYEHFMITESGTTLALDGTLLYRQPLDSSQSQLISQDTLLAPGDYALSSIMLLPNGDIMGTAYYHLYKSSDEGLTWEIVSNNYAIDYYFVMRAPLSDGTILANRNGQALYRSNDTASTWAFSSYGIGKGLADILYIANDSCWLAMNYAGLFKTTDHGENWNLLKAAKHEGWWHNEVLEWNSTGSIYFIVDDTLFRSNDLGGSFQTVFLPDSLHPRLRGVGIHEPSQSLFVSLKNGTARSADMGITWELVADSLYLFKMLVHPSGALYAILAAEQGASNNYQSIPYLYRSVDNGSSWEKIFDKKIKSFDINGLGEIYLSGSTSRTHKSIDGGNNWIEIPYRGPNIIANDANQLFEHDANKNIFMSIDFGDNWQTLPSVFPDGDFYSHQKITSDKQNRLYTSAWKYLGQYHLFRTTHSTLSGTLLTGTVSKDGDADCTTNDPESPLGGWVVRADGNDTWYANTDSTGCYTMFLDTGAYFLTVKPSLAVLWETCADSLPVQLPDLLDTTEQDVLVRAIADCPYMTVDVIAPWLEKCFESLVFVHYCNLGTEPADAAWVDVTLDPHLVFTDTTLDYEILGNNTFRFQLGAVGQGHCSNFYFSVYVECDSTVLGQTLCVSAHIYPDSLCITPPGWSGAEIQVTARCEQDTNLVFDVTNTGTVPSQGLQYFVIEDDVVLMQGNETYQPDQTRSFELPANGHFRRFESEQEPGHPFSMKVAAGAEGCGGFSMFGFPNWYFLNNGIPSQDVYCGEIVGAFDPNDKQGFPLGYGAQHLVAPNTDIEYLVRFQNTGTAPAHNVVVRDTLSPFLDPASLRMGAASHPFTWSLDGQGYLTITFPDINLPDSNANEAASHGFFNFKIAQKPDLVNGTNIRNIASIYFDFNGAIRTNETLHRIGKDFIVDVTNVPDPLDLDIRVFPNPMTESALLTFKGLPVTGAFRFAMVDALGGAVCDLSLDGNTVLLRRESLKAGIYFFQVIDSQGKKAGSGKLLVR